MNDFDNVDDLMAQMKQDELADASKLTPIEYGKLRSIKPQLVYYHIRQNHVNLERCICGRAVIDVKSADEYFKRGEFDPNLNGSMAIEQEED